MPSRSSIIDHREKNSRSKRDRYVRQVESSADPVQTQTKPATKNRRESFVQALGIFRYIRPYRTRFSAAIGALLVSTSLGLSFPYLTGLLLDAAVVSEAVRAQGGWKSNINTIALVSLGSLTLQAAFSFFATYWFSRSGESALVDLRKETFGRLIALPMAFFSQRRVGELTSRLTGDMAVIQDTLTGSVPQFLRQCILLIGGISLVAFTSIKLTGLMVVTFPVLILGAILIGRRIRRHARIGQDRLADGSTVVEESLQGIANVKAFGSESLECDRYATHLDDFLRETFKISRLRASLISFIILGIFGSFVGVFWYGAHLMQTGHLTFGELTRFIIYTTFVGGSVASFADLFGHVQKALGATERVRELLAEKPEMPLTGSAIPNPAARFHGEVVFNTIDFAYPSRPDVRVLRGLTLQARPGEKVALVGASGAGKSTIVSLLLRFYEPDSGQIEIDGRPASTIPLSELRANMAIVPQEVLLFGGTIEENILYGKPDASREEMFAASRGALCHEFIEKLPEGYQTLVGDRGLKLSGGQRQRIAIARALLKNPAILILDEATSSLDSESELLIQQALATLLAGRTAFIIAHRLSTIREANRIYVIEDGVVLESGTHRELLAMQDGTYRRLSKIQLSSRAETP
jgi:ATP-binding cassette subfamily B protein